MFQKFMNKKDFHPGSKWNIKRVWMAEQKKSAEDQKEIELAEQYKREQEKFENRQLISQDEKLKLGLSFIYDAPPGFKDKKDADAEHSKPEEEELKFAWLKGAPTEAYAKDLNLETHAQPFGIPVRNVRCIKCHKWGHVNTDRECPLHNKTISTEPSSLTDEAISDPLKLMQDMRNNGLAIKQNALGRVLDKDDPNQQYLASDEEDDDPELAFLATLNEKQKRKLLRKLDKLEKNEQIKKKKKKRKKSSSESEDENESKSKSEKIIRKKYSSESENESRSKSEKRIKKKQSSESENENKIRSKSEKIIRKKYSSEFENESRSKSEKRIRKKYSSESENESRSKSEKRIRKKYSSESENENKIRSKSEKIIRKKYSSQSENESRSKSEKRIKKKHSESCGSDNEEWSTKRNIRKDKEGRGNEANYKEKKGERMRKESRYSSDRNDDGKMYLNRKK